MSKEDDFARALEVLTGLGFRVDTIMPADDPAMAVVSGHGVQLRLSRDAPVEHTAAVAVVPSFVVTRNDPAAWRVGRAGMQYRDLIPDRLGGKVIASHIRIPEGGPVPDYVHFHAIRFQMIYCYKGWVRLVYEDQGEPFVMQAGECVLQPPEIRHRVLECSPGLEVIEIGSPAIHATHADHEMSLPTPALRTEREFGGQRFVWDRSTRDGIATASGGVAGARVLAGASRAPSVHDGELFFGFVLEGAMTVTCEGASERLAAADAFVVPAQRTLALSDGTPDLAWLEITLPAAVP